MEQIQLFEDDVRESAESELAVYIETTAARLISAWMEAWNGEGIPQRLQDDVRDAVLDQLVDWAKGGRAVSRPNED